MKQGKAPLEYTLYSVLEDEAWVLRGGAVRYGVRNWRKDRILASTYEGAMLRHFLAWARGEDLDPDSGKPHLIHLRACAGIVLDAAAHHALVDDRKRLESIHDESVQRETRRSNRRRRVNRKRAVPSDP